jgi:CheY-like chemotaxis protein/nitrogen-specific signal transduction histidine kinase
MFFFGREVARRERAEAERDRLLTSERAARTDAERASRIKDEFMATLSHELRTPLAAILGWCAILRTPRAATEAERAVETIERNARMQARLVDDLLDATRMQAGSLHLELSRVPLDLPVAAAIEGVGPAAEAKQLRIEFTCQAPAPVVVGDASRLQQIVSNLLVNAVKFSPAATTIRVSLRTHGGHAELSVADEGMGIDPVFVPQLFQRFRQAETGNARRHGGLGLGLSIVSSLVQLHGGEVRALSPGLGGGATFVVTLPLAVPLADTGRNPCLPDPDLPTALEGIRVIVVDDEADVRGAVSVLLEQSGAKVLALSTGATIESALAEFRPHVLVLDIGLPGEDGYSLIRRVRGLKRLGGDTIPAVSLTAHARDEDRAYAMDSGFQAHLAKPVQFPLLASTIRRLVGQLSEGAQN